MSGIGELPDIGTGDTFPKQQLKHLIAFKGGARNNQLSGWNCVSLVGEPPDIGTGDTFPI